MIMAFNPYTGTASTPGSPQTAPVRQSVPQTGPLFRNIGASNVPGRPPKRRPMGPTRRGVAGSQRRGVPPPQNPNVSAVAQVPGPWGGMEPPISPAMSRLIGNGGYGRG
jgi:hypothetical protein